MIFSTKVTEKMLSKNLQYWIQWSLEKYPKKSTICGLLFPLKISSKNLTLVKSMVLKNNPKNSMFSGLLGTWTIFLKSMFSDLLGPWENIFKKTKFGDLLVPRKINFKNPSFLVYWVLQKYFKTLYMFLFRA